MTKKEEVKNKIYESVLDIAILCKDGYASVRPIQLADVLMAIIERHLTVGFYFQIWSDNLFLIGQGNKRVFWNLKEDFDTQPQEVYDFLWEVLIK